MANTVAKLTAVLQMNNTQFKKGLTTSQKALKGFQNQVKAVGGMITGAFAVGALINFGREAVRLSAQAEGVRTAFMGLNDPTLLDDLKEATRGTVAELELMKQAVRAKNFKVPLDQLATFFQFATERAIQTGESVDYLVNSIIDGIGRKSTLVMDNLGISATELQEEIKKVGDFGQAAANIIAREMGAAGTVLDTTVTKLARAQAEWANFKVLTGEGLTKAFLTVSDALKIVYNPTLYASEQATRDLQDAVNDLSIDLSRLGNLDKLKSQMRAERAEYQRLMATVKTPDWGPGMNQIEDSYFSGNKAFWDDFQSGFEQKPQLATWSPVLGETVEELEAMAGLVGLMDDLFAEWDEEMQEALGRETIDAVKTVNAELSDLGNTQRVIMVGFLELGRVIGTVMNGAEQDTADLAQTLMNSVGQILMSTNNIYAMIAGGLLQLGSGIWDAFEEDAVNMNNYNQQQANVDFNISGQNLQGTLNTQKDYLQLVT